MINRALIGLLFLVFTLGIFGETIRGLCISVADGDTITIMADENGGRENKKMKIRLYAIDSPEGKQEFGLEAKKFVEKMVLNKRVEIDYKDTDQYGRIVGILNYEQYGVSPPNRSKTLIRNFSPVQELGIKDFLAVFS